MMNNTIYGIRWVGLDYYPASGVLIEIKFSNIEDAEKYCQEKADYWNSYSVEILNGR